jgi:hypothetical protein
MARKRSFAARAAPPYLRLAQVKRTAQTLLTHPAERSGLFDAALKP